ncbi:MFS family permease [Catenuloplanes nepalensis]|uniref:MFS family permease n=1 Tax=Catenuloplanes nepalensis TaxID=587533 RepID=A0ABT9N597_9ACTN|nr:MFS transporter [Catenuloplanes nepalensis]MDP9798884.1 MFS family permease [Catenuloplanes nepalensis]
MVKIRFSPGPVGGVLATTIAVVLPGFLVGGLAVQIGESFPLSPAQLGIAISVYFGVSALASIPAGRLVERYGSGPTARAAIVLSAASLLAVGLLANSALTLTLLLAAGAGANALGQIAGNAALARHAPPGRQGLSFGTKQAAIPLSTLLAGAAVPTVALTLGWRWAFVLAALLALSALPAAPAAPARVRDHSAPSGHATAGLVVVAVAATLAAGSANALGTFLVDATVARGVGPGPAGLALTLGGAVCVAARVLGGYFADKLPGRQLTVISAQLIIGAGGLALLTLGGNPALIAGVVLGFGLGWAWPGLMNFAVVRLHPRAPAAATSVTQTGVYAGGCLGPLTLGFVATHFGYTAMWLAAASAMLGAALCMALGATLLRRARPAA